jgi:hypothetical protein
MLVNPVINLRITGFLDFFYHPVFWENKARRFKNWMFPSSVEEEDTQLGPLERANLNHWTTPLRCTTAIYLPETRSIRQEITRKYVINL